jgi:hypothetical protein
LRDILESLDGISDERIWATWNSGIIKERTDTEAKDPEKVRNKGQGPHCSSLGV